MPQRGPAPILAPSSGCSHQPSPLGSYSSGYKNLFGLLVEMGVQTQGGRWRPQLSTQNPQTQPGEQKEEGLLTFRGSPLFGLQR